MTIKDSIINNILQEYALKNDIRENIRVYQGNIYIGNEIANIDQENDIIRYISYIKGKRIA